VTPSPRGGIITATVGAGRALDARDQQQIVGDRPERDQVLFAGDEVRVALALHLAAQIGAGAGGRLGERERDLRLARDHRRQEPPLLLLGRVRGDRPPDPVTDVDDHPQRAVRHREDLEQLQVARQRDPAAAVPRGRGQAQVPAIAKLVPQLDRHLAVALDPLRPAFALVAHVGAKLVLERRQIFGRGLL
jgi:hypothetical protein